MDSSFFINEKPVNALVCLSDKKRDWYAALLAKEVDCTYAHMIKVLDALSAEGIIIFEKEGRIKHVKLTDFGEELAHDFESVVRKLDKLKSEKK